MGLDVSGKKVAVVGMGRTAMALVRLLLRERAKPFVTEAKGHAECATNIAELERLSVAYECDGHTDEAFAGAELVIPSPGVPRDLPAIRNAENHGAVVLSEMAFASRYCRSRVVAVTGTNGKTTTTELIRAMIAACGYSVGLAGNNRTPLSAAVLLQEQPEYLVLEVSSYQLDAPGGFRPWIAVILNVTPDHLARHKTLEAYAAVKARIFENQGSDDHAIVNEDDPHTRDIVPPGPERWSFSLSTPVSRGVWWNGDAFMVDDTTIASDTELRLRGRHNRANVAAALTAMVAAGFDLERAVHAMREFQGVEHRLELAGSIGGVQYINDSKSTNPDSLRSALESFSENLVLLAGGEAKESGYEALRPLMSEHVGSLIAYGKDACMFEEKYGNRVPVIRVTTLEAAVGEARRRAKPGEVVLLSPGCASFDQFEDFEDRGRAFKRIVRRLEREDEAPAAAATRDGHA